MEGTVPSTFITICSWVGVIAISIAILIITTYLLAEHWRTKRGSTKYYYAYGHNDCNVKFVTGSNYRK